MTPLYHLGQPLPKTSGIYRITCTVNKKFYIGSSVNLLQRWGEHRKMLRSNNHGNIHLQRAWNKYGEETFIFEVIELVLTSFLLEREQFWIDKTQAVKKGFNIAKVAGSVLGITRSPETRKKISEAKKGKPSPNRGRKHTPEARAKMSEGQRRNPVNLGRKFSPEHRAKMSAASRGNKSNLGRKRSPESIEKTRIATQGRKLSDEQKLHLSKINTGKKHTAESKEKMSQQRRGKTHSPEAREKLRQAKTDKMMTLIVTDPDGKEYHVCGVQAFCKEHDLNRCTLIGVAKGKYGYTKGGWTARFPETSNG